MMARRATDALHAVTCPRRAGIGSAGRTAEFKTDVSANVITIDELVEFLKRHTVELIALNRMQYAVGRLETARLALSGETDVEHVESLRRRFSGGAYSDSWC